ADAGVPSQKVTDARYYLAFVYLIAGDPYRAAVVGEDLARVRPPTRRSAAAAAYALEAYAQILSRQDVPGNRDRVRDLAQYVIDNAAAWQGDPVTQVARYQLAMVALREKKYPEVIAQLEKLAPDFGSYVFAQCQLALTALKAGEDAETDQDR